MGRSWIDNLEEERDDLQKKCVEQENYIQKLNKLFLELAEHAGYNGYGDNADLMRRVNEMTEHIMVNF